MNALPSGELPMAEIGAGLEPEEGEVDPAEASEEPLELEDQSPTAPTRLRRSRHFVRVSELAAALSGLYSRGPLRRSVGAGSWQFRWRCLTESFTGTELRLRLGDADVLVGVESLAVFGAVAEDLTGIPARLQVAYLNGAGSVLWRELESITQRPVQVLELRPAVKLEVTPECLGFEVGRLPQGAVSRGFLQLIDSDETRNTELQQVLLEVSEREMSAALARTDLRIGWAAVVGYTGLAAAEVRALEEHDIVLIDDAKPTPNVLNCRLCVGPTRRYAGRVQWRTGGQLQMVQFDGTGEVKVSADTETPVKQEIGFDDIPVSLRFELAQWNASLGEVGKLAPGSVVDLGARLDDHAVSGWVEQRCIGKGQLVAIGERLGVRLLSVFASEHT